MLPRNGRLQLAELAHLSSERNEAEIRKGPMRWRMGPFA